MARVNIWIPDELLAEARAAKLPVSKLAQEAVRQELRSRDWSQLADELMAALEPALTPSSSRESLRMALIGVLTRRRY